MVESLRIAGLGPAKVDGSNGEGPHQRELGQQSGGREGCQEDIGSCRAGEVRTNKHGASMPS